MDKRRLFLELAERLDSAVQATDWAALAGIDRQVARALAALPAVPLAVTEEAAWRQLRTAHDAARAACATAHAQAHERLQALCDHRVGRTAYAMNEEHPQENPA